MFFIPAAFDNRFRGLAGTDLIYRARVRVYFFGPLFRILLIFECVPGRKFISPYIQAVESYEIWYWMGPNPIAINPFPVFCSGNFLLF